MLGKKGYIISYADWFKGFIIGILVGGAVAYLLVSGIVKIPAIFNAGPKESAKLLIPVIPFLFRRK